MRNDELSGYAHTFGTPLYVFDGRVLERRLERLRSALPTNVELCYAVKANAFIVPLLAGSVERLEACSGHRKSDTGQSSSQRADHGNNTYDQRDSRK